MDAQINNPGSELVDNIRKSESEPIHRFLVQDPFMDVNYRLPTAAAAIAQAEKLELVGVSSISADGNASQVLKRDGEWRVATLRENQWKADGKTIAEIQAENDSAALKVIEERAALRAAAGQGVSVETDKAMAIADAHAFRRIQGAIQQEDAAVTIANSARENPEYKNSLDKAIPGYPGTAEKVYALDAANTERMMAKDANADTKQFRVRENNGLELNIITEGKPIPLTNDKGDANTRFPVSASSDLINEIKAASDAPNNDKANNQTRSSIVSRADLRNAAANELAPSAVIPGGTGADRIDKETARLWADLDAREFGRIRSEERKTVAIDAVAGNMRASSDYAEALKIRSPALAVAGQNISDEMEKQEAARASTIQESIRQEEAQFRREVRVAEFDASAKEAVARIRAEQLSAVRVLLKHDPDPVLGKSDIADAQHIANNNAARLGIKTESPATDNRNQAAAEEEKTKILKRPIHESELPQDIRSRFIVSTKQDKLFEKGTTDFHFRTGNKQGELAFYDAGKQLVTPLSDKATIASMVEIAKSKNWEEITVSGSDEFRRQAWLEARLANIEVRGFEPKDVDKQLLAEMQKTRSPENRIVATDNVRTLAPKTTKEAESRQQGTHINVDELSTKEKAGLNQASALLQSKELSAQFSEAALSELEKKVRGERVYVGTAIDFGKAPYLFNKDNDASYFVNLKTQTGEKTIWGKQLEQAIANGEVQRGQDIVLSNPGKKDVIVSEKVFDEAGKQTGRRNKAATLNEWKAEPLTKFTDRSVNAAPSQPPQPEQDISQKRETQAPSRDR